MRRTNRRALAKSGNKGARAWWGLGVNPPTSANRAEVGTIGPMRCWIRGFFWGAWCWGLMASAQAWTPHAWGTWLSLQALPDVRAEAPVRVEPLEKFLLEQGQIGRAHV